MNSLTLEHYRQQVAVRAQALRDASRIWRLWTPGSNASWREMVAAAQPILGVRHGQSSALAAAYFARMQRQATGVDGRAVLAEPLAPAHVERSLAQTGLVGTYAAKSRGLSMDAAAQIGFVRFLGAVTKLTLTGGRETVLNSVAQSRRATGWHRVISGGACDFCQSLEGEPGPDDFQAHDNCTCQAEPVFT